MDRFAAWPFAVLAYLLVVILANAEYLWPNYDNDQPGMFRVTNREQCRRLCWYHKRCSVYSYSSHRGAPNCMLRSGTLATLRCGWIHEVASQVPDNGCALRPCDNDEVCVPALGQPSYNCLSVPSKSGESDGSSAPPSGSAADGLQFLAFRLTAGVNQSAYDKYVDSGTHDDTPQARASLLPGCLTLNGSLPCNTHYRSRLLDEWPGDAIDTVRVSVYNNGQQQRYVTFNGTGSTFLSWFAQDRVMASDWTDVRDEVLHRRGGFFSIEGFKYKRIIYRSFYVNRYHDGCSNDAGWLLVAEKDTCSYVPSAGPFPVILFSSADTYVSLTEAGYNKQADVLAVTVKFKKTPVAAFSGRCDA
ncbi:hypothetical protein BaRGS_00003922 [Batillaria attramentaria]|uniref:Apple domain-containing protein n=1 Tax=Batillaria attramentaria TaxID=370345 RepID=A0ABD0M0R2_9CAEN